MTTRECLWIPGRCQYCGQDVLLRERTVPWKETSYQHPCDLPVIKIVSDKGFLVTGHRSHYETCPKPPPKKEDRT